MTDEDFELPDPLPERLSGETNNAYRRRVIPGWRERQALENSRKRLVRRWVRSALKNDPWLDDEDVAAVRAEAREEWAARDPERAQWLAYLQSVVPAVHLGSETP